MRGRQGASPQLSATSPSLATTFTFQPKRLLARLWRSVCHSVMRRSPGLAVAIECIWISIPVLLTSSAERCPMKLNDPTLFRQTCQVADGWPLSRFCDQNDVITQTIDREFGLGSYLCARDLS